MDWNFSYLMKLGKYFGCMTINKQINKRKLKLIAARRRINESLNYNIYFG